MEKILIADDEQLMRQLVIDFLKPEGYEILEASDGKEALEIYDKEHPDLILLDVMMPGYDGWTVCREIRRESTVPITHKNMLFWQFASFVLHIFTTPLK